MAVPPAGVAVQEGEVVVGVGCRCCHQHCITGQTLHACTGMGNNTQHDATTTHTHTHTHIYIYIYIYIQPNLSTNHTWELFYFKSGLNHLKNAK